MGTDAKGQSHLVLQILSRNVTPNQAKSGRVSVNLRLTRVRVRVVGPC